MAGVFVRHVEYITILVTIANNEDRYHVILGAANGMKEDKANRGNFFQWVRSHGLNGVKLRSGLFTYWINLRDSAICSRGFIE